MIIIVGKISNFPLSLLIMRRIIIFHDTSVKLAILANVNSNITDEDRRDIINAFFVSYVLTITWLLHHFRVTRDVIDSRWYCFQLKRMSCMKLRIKYRVEYCIIARNYRILCFYSLYVAISENITRCENNKLLCTIIVKRFVQLVSYKNAISRYPKRKSANFLIFSIFIFVFANQLTEIN